MSSDNPQQARLQLPVTDDSLPLEAPEIANSPQAVAVARRERRKSKLDLYDIDGDGKLVCTTTSL